MFSGAWAIASQPPYPRLRPWDPPNTKPVRVINIL